MGIGIWSMHFVSMFDIRDFSTIKSGKLDLEQQPFHLR